MGLVCNGGTPNNVLYNGAAVSLYFNGSKIWPNTAPTPVITDYVTIGSQVWMSKNLEYDDNQGGIYTANIRMADNVTAHAYYYTHDAAVRVANAIPGWHLPTSAEYQTLINYAGPNYQTAGNNLKSRSGWYGGRNGYDLYGFNAFPEGYYDSQGASMGSICCMITQTQTTESNVLKDVYFAITNWGYYDGAVLQKEPTASMFGYNIRLVKD